ncbi:glycosyltransferase [Marinihelvus fidelis]|uniref:Glycosyltransferase n=1 Tax=Marinihelvus fidelis TaxID=2613842 RepID=A0A5N0TEG4_9GAMM|nr:glycosyltransferase [Marinihelvus fidelis]KAA9133061.1 glycosyltransferase [Marinihelvus fidelis]
MSYQISILLPDLRIGGVEKVQLSLAEKFRNAGFLVKLLVMQRRGDLLQQVPQGVAVKSLNVARIREAWWPLHQYLRKEQPDALLAAMWPLTGVASVACKTSGFNGTLIVSEHNDFRRAPAITTFERRLLRYLGRFIYPLTGHVVAVSQGVKDSLGEIARLPSKSVKVIHNPISVSGATEFAEEDRHLVRWWQGGAAKLLAVGNLKRQKGFDVLLDAMSMVSARLDVRLLIIGEGKLRAQLNAQCSRSGLGEYVRLVGARPDPGPFYNDADLFVLSSRWEGFGNVIVESLAYGTPVVSTDCMSGPAEILDNGRYGALVSQDDPGALAEMILRQITAPHDVEALKKRAAEFSPEVAANKYLTLFGPT